MIRGKITITNRLGIHARPAALIAQEAGRFKSEICLIKEDIEINAKSIMGVMMLAAEKGSRLTYTIIGPDELEAHKAMKKVFKAISQEDKYL
ncbi:MAG: HPr family phosphocarrier protein [Elusimicrobiaceae bacterium]|nr:HPr family phosphocarrier protein [Elusimicrobiaceae bacterium]